MVRYKIKKNNNVQSTNLRFSSNSLQERNEVQKITISSIKILFDICSKCCDFLAFTLRSSIMNEVKKQTFDSMVDH